MLISMREMIRLASSRGHAVGAFHALNLEQAQGILEAAVEEQTPVVICLSEASAIYAGTGAFLAMTRELAEEIPCQAALLLDHAGDVELIRSALDKGFDGVLADVRRAGPDEAVSTLREIKGLCDRAGAYFEVGVNLRGEDGALGPAEAARIVHSLDPNSLCAGVPRPERTGPRDDIFRIIEDLRLATERPVSLAGCGRWPDDQIKRALALGVWKISVATRTNQAFTAGLRRHGELHPEKVNPRVYLAAGREALREEVRTCVRLFGSV